MASPFFSFNLYSALLLVGWAQGSVYAFLLLLRWVRRGRLSELFAGLILAIATLYVAQWMLGFGGWYDAHDWRTVVMFYVPWDHLLALGPLVWLYFRAVTHAGFRWSGRLAWHFLPWALSALPIFSAGLYDLVYLLGMEGQALPNFFGTKGPWREFVSRNTVVFSSLVATVTYFQVTFYLGKTYYSFREYRGYLAAHFSDDTGRSFSGLYRLLLFLIGGILFTIAVSAYQSAFGEAPYVREWFHHFVLSLVAFAAGIQFLQVDADRLQALRFVEAGGTAHEPVAALPSGGAHLWERIQVRMLERKDYLEPDLRLAELADRLRVGDKQLSAVINACGGHNFNDFVNGLRCDHFAELLITGRHRERTLLALALESGFNSKSTFNRAFRKYYGFSPKEAINRVNRGENLSQKMI